MNTHKPVLTAKARHLCFVLLLCLCLAWGGVLGPCRHSVTKDHLLSLNRLIDNQLDNGCAISYPFTERHSLSKICYIKATFPHILELLNSHFQYARKSDNRRYVNTLKKMIYNLYSQGCIHEINEEIEDNPGRFARVFGSSPKDALKKAKSVFQMYMMLMSESLGPVDWSCQEEYAVEDTTESSTVVSDTSTTGSPECQCSCSISTQTTTVSSPANSLWKRARHPRPNQHTPVRPPRSLSPHGTQTNSSILSSGSNMTVGFLPSVTVNLPDIYPIKKRDTSWLFPPPTEKEHDPLLHKPEWSRRFPLGNRTQDLLKEKMAQSGADASPALYGVMDITQSSDENTKHVLAKKPLDSNNYGPPDTVLQNRVSSLKPKATEQKHRAPENTMDTSNHDTERVPFVAVHTYMMELHSYELKDSSMDLQTQAEDPKSQTKFSNNINAIQDIISKDVLPNIKSMAISRTSLYEGPKEKKVDGTSSWKQLSGQPVFTMAAVSGGFLLFFAFCCFIMKTRCEGLFHCPGLTEKKRVGKDVELWPCETVV